MFGWLSGRKPDPTLKKLARDLGKLTVDEAKQVTDYLAAAIPEMTPDDYRKLAKQLTEQYPNLTPEDFRRDYGDEAYRHAYGHDLRPL